ncbi:hypothetical protein MCNF_35410 [Mycolicibacterium confluentis]|uniref:Secreted protein n=1 Tax=Mycolicibacterium confluentis TaxID=28047 RepID=A0A7I7Y021_9MYCO|nr:hypothetical protein MCNF_35410 [Mycolicibacterium confluentis]
MKRRSATVLLMGVAVAAAGLFVAPGASAECIASRGTIICTDDGSANPSAPVGRPTGTQPVPVTDRGSFTPYPCHVDWFCDTDYGTGVGDVLYGHN